MHLGMVSHKVAVEVVVRLQLSPSLEDLLICVPMWLLRDLSPPRDNDKSFTSFVVMVERSSGAGAERQKLRWKPPCLLHFIL